MKVFVSSVLVLAVFLSKSNGDPMDGYKTEMYDGGNYKVMWKYDMIMDRFNFKVMVKAMGWVGFGVSKNKGGMVGYDVMVGSVRNDSGYMNDTYVKDYYTTAQAQPSPDDMQDYMMTSATQMDGYTNITFYRKRNTGDADKDVEIKPGEMFLIWAYHLTNDIDPKSESFKQHSEMGAVPYTFIDAKYTIVQINANYRLYWKYDEASDMFYFTVVVKATGWIAFAVSTQRGGMVGYDAMVGGVNGTGYIGDYMTTTTSQPPKDAQQDFNMTSSEERDGYTKLTFHRKRNTGDDKDIEIKKGKMNIIWAYHLTDDVVNDKFKYHGVNKGGMEYTFIQDPAMMSTTPAATTATKSGSAMFFPSLLGIIGLLLFQRVIGA